MEQSTFLWEEPPVSLSQSQDLEGDWMMIAVTWHSNSLGLLNAHAHDGWFGRTSLESCQVTEEGILEPFSGRWGKSGMGSPTEFLTLNTSEWHKDADVCLLSDTLETGDVPQRYFLSAKACQGILRRAEKRGKSLPPSVTTGAPFSRTGNERVECDAYIPSIANCLQTTCDDYSRADGFNMMAFQSMAVRRLTPVECERLQGFPDNYTNIKDGCPDSPRYKALGNSMAVPVMKWIGKRIQKVDEL